MKQNERLLVYAVSGFLALILVIAVLFGNDSKAGEKKQDKGLQNLSDLLQPPGAADKDKGAADKVDGGSLSGIAPPNAIVPEQPLLARPQLAAEVVARELGTSRRDHNVRFVRVGRGDSLESLVRKWCGTTESFLDEAKCLNEELQANRLQIGQEVGLPWVDDETLMGLIQQRAPRTLVSELNGAGAGPVSYDNIDPSRSGGSDGSGRIGLPEFALPGGQRGEPAAGAANGGAANGGATNGGATNAGAAPSIAGTTAYKVVAGDSLWKIAAKKYGKGKADKMVREILALNPGLTEDLKVGQTFQLPAAR